MTQHQGRAVRAVSALAAAFVVLAGAATASAHESDAVSDPPSGSVIDEAISEVDIEFGVDISDDIELALFGPGDDNLIEPTTTTKTASNAAKIEFEPLEQRGTYIVRYLGVAPVDGHTIVGAVSFTYGSDGGSDTRSWIWFLLAMIPILAVGTAWSYRLHTRQRAEREAVADGDSAGGSSGGSSGGSEVDEDLPDVRV